MRPRVLLALAFCLAGCACRQAGAPFKLTWTEGQCDWRQVATDLRDVQFVSRREAWGIVFSAPPPGAQGTGDYVVAHTTDAGRTWKEVPQSPQHAVAPSFWFVDSTHGWFGCWNVPCAVAETKLFRTTDAGGHWEQVSDRATALNMAFSDETHGLAHEFGAGDSGGMVRTSDGGRHWAKVEIPNRQAIDRTVFLSGQIGWVSERDDAGVLLFRTVDGGNSWTESRAALPPDWPEVREISFLDRDHGWLVLKHKTDGQIRILATLDGGRAWSRLATPSLRTTNPWPDVVRFVSARTGFIFVTEQANPKDEGWGEQKVLYTADGGEHWLKYPLPYSIDSCQAFEGDLLCSASSPHSRIGVLTLHPK